MATKLQLITAIYEHNVKHITDSGSEWQGFLRSASRNYKLPFEEQLLVHAQRPDAVAVLEIEKWNRKFGRWVNRGAAGIAVIDRDVPGKRRLRYYFDISDTHRSRYARPVPLWEMKPEYEGEVIEALENSFGELGDKGMLVTALFSAAKNAVDDNINDYLAQLMDCRDSSMLEGFTDDKIAEMTRELLHCSVAYMMFHRCGLDASHLLGADTFSDIACFNTPDTVTVLGAATGDIAEMGLREIASTVLNLEKSEKNLIRTFANEREIGDNAVEPNTERSFSNDIDLQQRERVQDSRPDPAGGAGSRAGTLRADAQTLSPESPQGAVYPTADERRPEPAPDGNRAGGDGAAGTPDRADGESRGRDGGAESGRPDSVDSADDEHPQPSGGNDFARPDLQLNLFPSPEEQLNRIEEETESAKVTAEKPSAFSSVGGTPTVGLLPQEAVDEELTRGDGVYQQKFRIYRHFQELHTEDETVKFLKSEYGEGSHSPLGDSDYRVASSGKGMTFTKGDLLSPDLKYTLPWAKVAKRIAELIAADRYLNAKDKEVYYPQYLEYQENRALWRQKNAALDAALALPFEQRRDTLVPRIVDFLNGLNEDSRYLNQKLIDNGLEEIADTASAEQIEAILADPAQAQRLMNAMQAIGGASTGIFERNHGYRFREELAAYFPRQPVYHLGDTVYIGAHEYEVLAFDDFTVKLFDTEFPLFDKEMPREEFDRKIAETPANEHLMTVVMPPVMPEAEKDSKPPKSYVVGGRLVLDLRTKHTGLIGEFQISGVSDSTVTVTNARYSFSETITHAEAEQCKIQPIAEHILREPGTDYYLLRYPDGVDADASLGIDELPLITEYAKQYVICAESCHISESDMEQWNISFRKMPRDWNMLPSGA